MEFFDTLPVSAVIDNKFLCLHGGLSPDLDVVSVRCDIVVCLCHSQYTILSVEPNWGY